MPLSKVMTTLAQCELCPTTLVHVAGTGSPLALDFFFAHHWDILPSETLDGTVTVACPRCAPILTTVTRSIDRGLTKAGA